MAFDWGKNAPEPQLMGVSSDETDSLDGLDSEVAPEDQKWLTTDKERLKQLAAQEAKKERPVRTPVVDNDTLGMLGLNDQPASNETDDDEMSEVEFRLEKAQCYKMLINHQLLAGDSKAAEEVEGEVQDFVRTKLGELMGMLMSNKTERIEREPPIFTEDEVAALKAVAAKVLGKPSIVVAEKPPTPVAPRPAGTVTPAPAPVKRGRGRPRKYVEDPVKSEPTKKEDPNPNKPRIETLPDGTRIKHVGTKRYKLVKRPVQYKDGTFGEEDIEMDVTPMPRGQGAKPYPSEAEVAQAAQTEAAQNLGKSSNLIKGLAAVSMAQPTKEE